MSFFAEKKAFKLFKTQMRDFIRYTSTNLARSFPDGKRFDSSNPGPQMFWNAGLQMCALNYQKPDRSMQLNEGRFSQNGRCGYVLKPPRLRDPENNPMDSYPPFTILFDYSQVIIYSLRPENLNQRLL